jgi:endonuclease/exonuclease/phosphatase family metal-dependent hydrolase
MRTRILLFCMATLGLCLTGCSEHEPLQVITFNVRYDNPGDSLNAWPRRADLVAEFLNGEKPDLLGMQEVLAHQYEFIKENLTGYGTVGVGRTDGKSMGEMCPVFFRSDKFELLDNGTFWLSETPDSVGSMGPGAVLPRIVTWVELNEITSGRKLFFFNTHFCHVSDSARMMGAAILAGAVKRISGDHFFIVTGDFNLRPDSKAYSTLTGEGGPWRVLYDTWLMSETSPAGPSYTFNGFSDNPGEGRIDYIFVPAATMVLSHETMVVKKDDLFVSDHWPVRAVIKW